MKRILVNAVLVAVTAGPGRADTPAPTTVPFELLKSRHMAVQVKINGKGPYRVIFDTGAPVTLLNTRVARASGVIKPNARPPLFSMFGAMGQANIRTLKVGDLEARNVTAVVMDHPTVELISKVLGPIEGIVGFPFFARYKMTIDYQAKELTFVPNGFQPPDAMQALMTSVMSMADDRPAKAPMLAPAGQWGVLLDKEAGDDEAGVTVQEVLAASAAAVGGVKAGDRLLTLDGRWTDSVADAYAAAGHVPPGTQAKLTVRRNGRDVELTVTPRTGR